MAAQRIKFVPQRGHGCGIACVAMLAGVSYDEAKTAFPPDPDREAQGTSAKDVMEALARFGIRAEALKPSAREAYLSFESDAVLRGEIKEPGENNDWHWVVWDGERRKILDPYRPKHEFRCTSFLRITNRP